MVRNPITDLRPEFWREVAGQEEILPSLKNMIESGAMRSAILFIGPMGFGKTTLARLLAKATSCTGRLPSNWEPCGECAACRSFVGDMYSRNSRYLGSGIKLDDKEFGKMIHDAAFGTLWGETRYGALHIDDFDCLPRSQMLRLRSALDVTWQSGYLVATTAEPEKVDAPLRQRMQEFILTTPDEKTLEIWVKYIAINRLHLTIEDDHALGQLVRWGKMNFRRILKILGALEASKQPLNSVTVKQAASQCGYGLDLERGARQ